MDKVLDHDTSSFETNVTGAKANGRDKLKPSLASYGYTGRSIRRDEKDVSVHSVLQARHDEQIGFNADNSYTSITDLSKYVAWTWIPGRDRKVCPPLVDLRDARLLVMDRFSDEPDALPTRIGLSMFRPYIEPSASVVHASPTSVLVFKDFSLRPFPRAKKLVLDAENVEAFETGLDLDRDIRLAAKNLIPTVDTFSPPEVLFAFAENYRPIASRNAAMLARIIEAFHPDSSPLSTFISPGMYVNSIGCNHGKTTVSYTTANGPSVLYLPDWLEVEECVRAGENIPKGVVFADLPRENFSTVEAREVFNSLSEYDLAWLEDCVLDHVTEFHHITEEYEPLQAGHDLSAGHSRLSYRFRFVPAQYVPHQLDRVSRIYMDFRSHLGRNHPHCTDDSVMSYDVNEYQVAVNVMQFPNQPTIKACTFNQQADGEAAVWRANLLETSPDAPWSNIVDHRG